MAEYIEREAVIEAIRNRESADKFCVNEGLIIAMNALDDIPAADVRPVVRGEWRERRFSEDVYGAECSVCHTTWDYRTNFCPNCGADMRAEPKEKT